jgi:hypothetical protein
MNLCCLSRLGGFHTKRLLNGDRTTAADYLRKSLATEAKTSDEYQFAKAELHTLGK